MRLFRPVSILFGLLLIGGYVCLQQPRYRMLEGKIFGTYYKIKIPDAENDADIERLIAARLEEINGHMSVFEGNSELSQINRAPAGQKIFLSPDMSRVMRAASEVYRASDGWFDPSLGKLIDMWGFGAGKLQNPSAEDIQAALASTGFNLLNFSKDFSTLTKTRTDTYINLSAIAKGYGVDAVAEILDRAGYENYVVDIGGELRTRGVRADGRPWNIGINAPEADSRKNAMVVPLSGGAVATSGNYRNFYRRDGKILAHTISSRTGRPVQTDILSASVFAPSCMYADAYATAIMAMGSVRGMEFADKNGLEVIMFDNNMQPLFSKAAREKFTE